MDYLGDITGAHSSPFDCTILVHPTIRRLERVANEIMQTKHFPVLDIGKELSSYLLDVPHAERTRTVRRWFDQQIDLHEPGPLVCNHIDILFLPTLNLDPLAMFRQASRRTKLLVLWPGELSGKTLSYAVPIHSHYRAWDNQDPSIAIYHLDD